MIKLVHIFVILFFLCGYSKEFGNIFFACLIKTCPLDFDLRSSLPAEIVEWPQYFDCAKVA